MLKLLDTKIALVLHVDAQDELLPGATGVTKRQDCAESVNDHRLKHQRWLDAILVPKSLPLKEEVKDDVKSEKYFVHSIEDAIIKANNWISEKFKKNEQSAKRIFIFGGGQIYKLALNFCSQIELTLVDINIKNGVSFPVIDEKKWEKKIIQKVEGNDSYPSHSFWIYNRKKINL